MMTMIDTRYTASYHSIRRNEKRFGMHGFRRSFRQLQIDVRDGRRADQYTGRERAWLIDRSSWDRTAYACGGKCLIVAKDGTVITLFPLPSWFRREPVYDGKTRIRSVKRYMRLRWDEEEMWS